MLITSVPFDPETDSIAKSVKQSVFASSRIVVVCGKCETPCINGIITKMLTGAGISLAAGIPTFRGNESISKSNRNLFNIESLQVRCLLNIFVTKSNCVV